MTDFLLELRSEEIPARMQAGARADLEKLFRKEMADAGVVVGDNVVRIEKTVVPGASAFTLKEHMDFVPGVPKTLGFRRANGSVYDVTFVRAR